jgi:Family of unknown function (DUF6600)/FecR protein
MRIRLNFKQVILGMGALTLIAANLAWAQELSHVRIVRLSFKEGTVTLVRPDAPGGVEASVNTPIQEGFKLATAENSFAEVEFENTSTARAGQLTELDFNQLALDSNGAKVNRIELRQGYATFSVIPEDGDIYEVKAGDATVNLNSKKTTLFRVDLDSGQVRVEVFKGSVEVASIFGTEGLNKNAVLEIRPGTDQPLTVSRGITEDAWDKWVEDRENQAQLANRQSPGLYTNDATTLLYGWNDLTYYGSWSNIPGYGYGWIPSMGYGWSPYSNGQWMWYPGLGYTWISYEPWGWMPFHYGGWVFEPIYGWVWIPGGFSSWSPGLVTWYQGPGWVGWVPRRPPSRPRGRPMSSGPVCAPGQTCATVVSTESFRAGLPVRGHSLPTVNVTEGFAVARPDVQPMGPGGPVYNSETSLRSHTSPAASGPANRIAPGGATRVGIGTRPVAARPGEVSGSADAATEGRIVFDSAEGRYVNGPAPIEEPARVEAPSTALVAPDAASAFHEAPRSAGSSSIIAPGSPHVMSGFQPAIAGDHHASPRTGVESPRKVGTFERVLGSWGSGTSTHQSAPARSGSWSAPSSRNSGSFGGNRGGGASGGGFSTAAPRGGGGGGGGRGGAVRSAPSSGPHR